MLRTWHTVVGVLAGALVGALAQALLWEKGASKFIYQFTTVLFLDSVARELKINIQVLLFSVYLPI